MSEVMEINATEAIENIIDRSNWTKWKFSDLVDNIVEKVVPKDSGLDHYIGLKHLDTGSLKIRRFGETESLIGNKLKIYKGNLIFAKRNSYLKRVAIADFDAVASAHALVLRPKPDNVNPDFLPFFMMSEKFWQRAIEISVGSLSPTINWKVLAKQEFLLPPKDQQAKLAKLLWAMDAVIEKNIELLNSVKQTYETLINQFMIHGNYQDGPLVKTKCGLLDSRIKTYRLKDCLSGKPMYGANASSKAYEMELPRYIRITDIDDEGNLIEDEKVTIDSKDYKQYILNDNDFLFARTGNTVGKTLLYKNVMGNAVFAGYLIKFNINEELLIPQF